MHNLKVKLTLYEIPGKKFSLHSGVVKDFQYPGVSTMASGQITFIDRVELYAGDTAEAYTKHMAEKFLGDYKVGTTFGFGHGPQKLGEGIIIDIIGWEQWQKE